jgi:O-glycosyl hydrolase
VNHNSGAPIKTGAFRVFPDQAYQQITDFGASACWWATGMGHMEQVDQYLDVLYGEKGLGLNVLRINVGGSVKADLSDTCTHGGLHRCPPSPLDEAGNFDVKRDAGNWRVAEKAAKLSAITDFTIFMNSPPTTMTKNGKTFSDRPAEEGQFVSNLREDCYEAYAKYVVDCVEGYIENGVPVTYVSPINEPQWQWDDRNHQEGCHYTPEEVVRMCRLVIRELNARAASNPKLAGVKLSMPETAQWYQRPYVHDMYRLMCQDPEIAPHVDHFAAHSYGTSKQQKIDTRAYFDSLGIDIPLHQTEWAPLHCDFVDNMDFALEMGHVMCEDFAILHTRHWTWWLGVSGFGWPDGIICVNKETGGDLALPKRYFTMLHHTRFIKGLYNVRMDMEDLPEKVTGAAYASKDKSELVLILVNSETTPQKVTFEGIPAKAARVFETSQLLDCLYLGDQDVSEGYILPPRSITNLVFK